MDKEYYSIGEIAEICNIPIRTLRYYDEIGLLVPEKRDIESSYRYYARHQILQANIINQFKVQGYSIKEIKHQLANNSVSLSEETLNQKHAELKKTIAELNKLEKRLGFFLECLKYQDHQLHLQLKEIPEIYIAYVRQQGLADQAAFMRRFSELNTLCRKNNLEPIGNIMARYYDDYQQYDPDCADVEVSIQIDLNHEIGGVVRKEPGYLCVSALHYGPYRDEYKTYTLMMEWMKKNNLVMCGPAFNYLGYGKMAANIAYDINQTTDIPAFAAMSKENEETINEFKDKIHIIETPKKGGIGLNESLDGMCKLAKALVDHEDLNPITSKYCF